MDSSAAPTARPLPELPNEIFLLIIQRSSGATKKQLRLVSKTLAQFTEPYLWRKVVVTPNDHCILAFIKAIKRSKVLRHITKLTYDGRFGTFFSTIRDVPADLDSLCAPDEEEETAKDRSWLDRTCQGHFKGADDMAIEVACLSKLLRLLPNLKEVSIREFEDGSHIPVTQVPSFYLKICRRLGIDPDNVPWSSMNGIGSGRSYTKAFLTAAFSADCRFQQLKAKNIDGHVMFGLIPMKTPAVFQQMSIFKNIMDSLRHLELSFRNETLMASANHLEAIQQLLKAGKRLRSLKLRLSDWSTGRYHADDDPTSDLCGLVETSTGTWLRTPLIPKLEYLIVESCVCHDEDLIHFLKIHATTLRHLELSNITLLGADDRRECWVKVIKALKMELKLSSISFSGWFNNGGRQRWSVTKDPVGGDRLKAKVEKYVVDRRIRQCPLDRVAIKSNGSDVEKPKNGEEFEGDLTWTMVYSSRYSDFQLTTPSFGITSDSLEESNSSPPSGIHTPSGHSDSDSMVGVLETHANDLAIPATYPTSPGPVFAFAWDPATVAAAASAVSASAAPLKFNGTAYSVQLSSPPSMSWTFNPPSFTP